MWFIIVIVVVVIFIAVVGSNANKTEQDTIIKADNELKGKGFVATENSRIDKTILAWDKDNQKIAIITFMLQHYKADIFDYKAIRDAEIIKDGETVFKKSAMRTVGGAVVGGVLLGG